MQSTSDNKIRKEPLHLLNEKNPLRLAKVLERKTFPRPFNLLKNCNLLSSLLNNKYYLTSNYIHLLDQELLDEN